MKKLLCWILPSLLCSVVYAADTVQQYRNPATGSIVYTLDDSGNLTANSLTCNGSPCGSGGGSSGVTLSSFSATSPILYSSTSSNGNFSFTGVTLSSFSATTPLTYNSTTGNTIFTGVTLSSITASAPVLYNSTTGNLTFSNTIASSQTFTAQHVANGGYYLSNPNTVTATYTAVSTDTVILANSPNTTGFTIKLPASSSSLGQVLEISKVDTTTGPVIIQAAGSDVIAGTATIRLNAYMQTDSIVSDGNGHWLPWGQGLQMTPPSLSFPVGQSGVSQVSVAVASDTDVCPIYVPVPVAVTGFRIPVVTQGGTSSYSFAIYDASLNLIVSTGPVLIAGTGMQNIPMSTAVNLPAGTYLMGMQISNTTTAVGGATLGTNYPFCSKNTGSTPLTLPSTFTLGTVNSRGFFLNAVIAGGRQSE